MDTKTHNSSAIKLDFSFVPDVKSLIEWLRIHISDMESLRDEHKHKLDSDDELTLLTCKIALQSISEFIGKNDLNEDNLVMLINRGINTVVIQNEVRHITDLDSLTLISEWSKLIDEQKSLYAANKKASSGWRGLLLRALGINLPQKPGAVRMLAGANTDESMRIT